MSSNGVSTASPAPGRPSARLAPTAITFLVHPRRPMRLSMWEAMRKVAQAARSTGSRLQTWFAGTTACCRFGYRESGEDHHDRPQPGRYRLGAHRTCGSVGHTSAGEHTYHRRPEQSGLEGRGGGHRRSLIARPNVPLRISTGLIQPLLVMASSVAPVSAPSHRRDRQ